MTSRATAVEEIRYTRSPDGTTIGWRQFGTGPALVIVHGSLTTGEEWRAVAEELASEHTIFLVDRRGRGLSGDADGYRLADEAADIQAVLAEAGPQAALLGHSYGGVCAAAAVAAGAEPSALVLYEPPLPVVNWTTFADLDRVVEALQDGDGDRALSIVLRDMVGLDEAEFAALRNSPRWEPMVAITPTFERENRALHEVDLDRFTKGRPRTLLLLGSDSPRKYFAVRDFLVERLPEITVVDFPGQQHYAHLADPAGVADTIRTFLARK